MRLRDIDRDIKLPAYDSLTYDITNMRSYLSLLLKLAAVIIEN